PGGRAARSGPPLPRRGALPQPPLLPALRPAGQAGTGVAVRRAVLAALALALIAAPGAGAHPLGNFSINHLTQVRISSHRVDLRYILDQAEIPTFQERGLSGAQVLDRKRAEVSRGLELLAGGRPVPLTLRPGGALSHPPGQGGLPLTRVVLSL